MHLWSYLHFITWIPTLIFMIFIGIILRKVLLNKPNNIKMIPFRIFAILLIILEIIKQIISIRNGYNLFNLPFHLCSVFLVCIPLMAFYNGKHSNLINSITATLCMLLLIVMLIMPAQIYKEAHIENFFNNFLLAHKIIFHNIVIFEFILILCLDLYKRTNFVRYIKIFYFACGYVIVASTAAQLLKTNYSNFYFCQMPILQSISNYMLEHLGNVAGTLMHIFMVGTTHVVGIMLSYSMLRIAITQLQKIIKGLFK